MISKTYSHEKQKCVSNSKLYYSPLKTCAIDYIRNICDIVERANKSFLRTLYFETFGVCVYLVLTVRYEALLEIFHLNYLDTKRKLSMRCFLNCVIYESVDDARLLASKPRYMTT